LATKSLISPILTAPFACPSHGRNSLWFLNGDRPAKSKGKHAREPWKRQWPDALGRRASVMFYFGWTTTTWTVVLPIFFGA
jgi:hypothetical protein